MSRLYCNDNRFHNIPFNEGLNVVLGRVCKRDEVQKDSHNLGKSTLIEVLDFLLLKNIDKNHFFKKYSPLFDEHIFYLEIALNDGTFLTIRRSVSEPTRISFKRSEATMICTENTVWDESNMALAKAITYLNERLGFSVLPDWSYRKTVSFFLRTQKDYINVFQLGKFQNGKHKDWKPVVFELLGYDSRVLKQKYELDERLDELRTKSSTISDEMSVNADDYDKVKSALALRMGERDEMQQRVDAFSFYSEEQQMTQNLVDEIERSISKLNTRDYALSYDLERVKASIANLPTFDLEQLKQIYEEVKIYFPDNLSHGFEDLYEFNVKVTKERNHYLREQAQEIDDELRSVRRRLQELDQQRRDALAALQDRDTFHKFKSYQKKLAQLEGDVSRLEIQLHNVDVMATLNDEIEKVQQEQKEISKEITNQIKNQEGDIPTSIKRCFNEIFRTVFGVSALLYVRTNTTGNVDFFTDVAPDENAEATAEAYGNTYKKMLCVAFDLAVLATYSANSFFRFVYHDGVFEGLDNRKKELFVQVARDYCQRYNLQYIFSSIEDDVPQNVLSTFVPSEQILTLSDQDDSGKLFGFSF
ncbi:MAG: DUF2326 domain-containing protein [Bacteroidales bacterium]|nr:DUF2326 domain-containing protein [Bacteroidales bacterium]